MDSGSAKLVSLRSKEKGGASVVRDDGRKGLAKQRRQSAPAAVPARPSSPPLPPALAPSKASPESKKENDPPMPPPPPRPRRHEVDLDLVTDPKEAEHSYVNQPGKIVLCTTSLPDRILKRVEQFVDHFNAEKVTQWNDKVGMEQGRRSSSATRW